MYGLPNGRVPRHGAGLFFLGYYRDVNNIRLCMGIRVHLLNRNSVFRVGLCSRLKKIRIYFSFSALRFFLSIQRIKELHRRTVWVG